MSSSARASAAAFVAATETALAELLAADLSGLDLVALMFDGVHFGEFCCVVALGIDLDGVKHPLALQEGSTENATLVTDLLTGLRDRGLDVTRPTLVVIDGSKAIESMISICRHHAHNVKRWRDGQMALRWCAAGMVEAGTQFRRVNGHLHLATLRAALDAEIAGTVTPAVQDEEVVAA
jgi:hypothetical protein